MVSDGNRTVALVGRYKSNLVDNLSGSPLTAKSRRDRHGPLTGECGPARGGARLAASSGFLGHRIHRSGLCPSDASGQAQLLDRAGAVRDRIHPMD